MADVSQVRYEEIKNITESLEGLSCKCTPNALLPDLTGISTYHDACPLLSRDTSTVYIGCRKVCKVCKVWKGMRESMLKVPPQDANRRSSLHLWWVDTDVMKILGLHMYFGKQKNRKVVLPLPAGFACMSTCLGNDKSESRDLGAD